VRTAVAEECARCGEPLREAPVVCGLCGSPTGLKPPAAVSSAIPAQVAASAVHLVHGWRNRYGLLPLVAFLGVLPLFPLTSVLGIVAGGIAVFRIRRRRAPAHGFRLALAGMVGGLFWIGVGIYLAFQASEFVRSIPFIPAPLRWFWNWQIGADASRWL
jgi:hypothetical protein